MKKIAVFFILLIFWSCEPPPSPTEPFYCKINGKRWRPAKQSGFGGSELNAEWNKKGSFNILATNYPELLGMVVKLNPNEEISLKEYPLNGKATGSWGDFYYDYSPPNPVDRELLISYEGFVRFTKKDNHLVSGVFEFKVKSSKKNKTFTITKGEFNNLYYSEY